MKEVGTDKDFGDHTVEGYAEEAMWFIGVIGFIDLLGLVGVPGIVDVPGFKGVRYRSVSRAGSASGEKGRSGCESVRLAGHCSTKSEQPGRARGPVQRFRNETRGDC